MIRLRKRVPLPPRDFPLLLRHGWRVDLPYKLGRLRALTRLDGPRTPRPPSLIEKAKARRIAALNRLTMDDVPRVERFGLHRVPQDVADEIALLRAVRETVAAQAIAAE